MGTFILVVLGIMLIVAAGALLYVLLLIAGFNFVLFTENLIAVDRSIEPIYAWIVLGVVMGVFAGLWRAGSKYRAGFLKPIAVICPLVLLAAVGYITKPISVGAGSPYGREERAAREREGRERIRYVTTSSGANIRSGPSTNYQRVATLPRGTPVWIIGEHEQWYQVRYSSSRGARQGYIYKSLVGTKKP
jgi:hypothetical protein